jgi:hypothetical protein
MVEIDALLDWLALYDRRSYRLHTNEMMLNENENESDDD